MSYSISKFIKFVSSLEIGPRVSCLTRCFVPVHAEDGVCQDAAADHDGRPVDPEVVLQLPPLRGKVLTRAHRDEPANE